MDVVGDPKIDNPSKWGYRHAGLSGPGCKNLGQFENRGQTDLSTRRKNRALGQIRLSPVFKLTQIGRRRSIADCHVVDLRQGAVAAKRDSVPVQS
jgi:hypothetical protein